MTHRPRVVVYVTRENPQTALDELVVLDGEQVPEGVQVVRELGADAAARYVHGAVIGEPPPAWEERWETLRLGMGKGAFVDDLVRRRVVIYATRDRGGRTELLTIETLGYPEDGLQVPAGRIDHGETLEDGLRRELEEETGLTAARIVREVPDFRCSYRTFSHNHAFHVVVDEETPDAWEHRVRGSGVDAGFTHLCRWVPFSEDLPLWDAPDPMLAKLGL